MKLTLILLSWLGLLAAQARAKAVFAHFMVGNANNYTLSDWETDIELAQAAHIDAFAMNIAYGDRTIYATLELGFQAAASKGFKMFFSFDYAGGVAPWPADNVIALCNSFCGRSPYFRYNGKPFLSTFEGPDQAEDWIDVKAKTGCFFMPDWSSRGAKPALQLAGGVADGLFSWASWAWGAKPIDTYVDASYMLYLNQSGVKPYMMPASPWFFTNLPGYDKNWLWRGDNAWYDRWVHIIYNQPEFVQIISWNDYGECHHIGPLYNKAMEAFTIGRAPYNYALNMPHDGWRQFLPFVIDTYKNGIATIQQEGLVAWFRPSPKGACGDGGTTGNTASQLQLEFEPVEVVEDAIFFSALLGSAASITVTVGGAVQSGATWTSVPDGGIGIYHGSVPFSGTGPVVVTLKRGGTTIATVSGGTISNSCPQGITNWNAWVGYQMGGSISATPSRTVAQQKCIKGTGPGNFQGLCQKACGWGYCPVTACVCQAMGAPPAVPSATGAMGYPIAGLDASYSGLCGFLCPLGYCPSSACSTTQVPLVTPTVSPFDNHACTGGQAAAGNSALSGLCSYACNYGFCPINSCTCTSEGTLVQPPAKMEGHSGKPVAGLEDSGLCRFACERGYCPSGTCIETNSSSGGDGPAFPGKNNLDLTKVIAGDWASDNGQGCVMFDCLNDFELDPPIWGPWVAIAPNGGPFKDDCPDGSAKYIVCPITAMPSSCQWRGGEDGCSCSGQCEVGEIALFNARDGSKSCCGTGRQTFCCRSHSFSEFIKTCAFQESSSTCPNGKTQYSWKFSPRRWSWFLYQTAFCCSPDAGLSQCHWVEGNGECEKAQCASHEIEVAKDLYGQSHLACPLGRKRALCCTPPDRASPWVPANLEDLFPTLPPVVNKVKYDYKPIAVQNTLDQWDQVDDQAFGFLVISGPSDVLSSLTRRSNSHVQFLDCDASKKKQDEGVVYTARYICTDNSPESNCNAVHEGGANGTVVELPEDCGFAKYGVVHDIRTSANGGIPWNLRGRVPANSTVYEMDFSYDFKRVKRGTGDVYFRFDYADSRRYWDEIVTGPAVHNKRSEPVKKRFWSPDPQEWKHRIDSLRKSELPAGYDLLMAKEFDQVIYRGDKRSSCDDGSGFLSIKIKGALQASLRWGVTVVGTISPSLNVEEAYGFFDTDAWMGATASFDGNARIGLNSIRPHQLLDSDNAAFEFTHPGIVSATPRQNAEVSISGSGSFNGKFDVFFISGSDGFVTMNAPLEVGDVRGKSVGSSLGSSLTGSFTAEATEDTDSSGTVLALNIVTNSWLDLNIFGLGTDTVQAKPKFMASIPHYIRVQSDRPSVGSVSLINADQELSVEISPDTMPWDGFQAGVGGTPRADTLYKGPGSSPDTHRTPPSWSGSSLFGSSSNYLQCKAATQLTCLNGKQLQLFVPELLIDPDTGTIYHKKRDLESGSADGTNTTWHELDRRGTGEQRTYKVKTPSGREFIIRSHTYPNGLNGQFLLGENPNAGFYTLEDPEDCEITDITDSGPQSGVDYVTEHIVELNFFPQLLEFMMKGKAKRTDGTEYTVSPGTHLVPEGFLDENSLFQTPWNQFHSGFHPPGETPIDSGWRCMGDTDNPAAFVNADSMLNGAKMRLNMGWNPVADSTWKDNGWDKTDEEFGSEYAQQALSSLRLVMSVFDYYNADKVNLNFADTITGIHNLFQLYQQIVQRIQTNVLFDMPGLTLEFVYNVLIPRLESADTWVRSRLVRLHDRWTTALNDALNAPSGSSRRIEDINSVINAIDEMLRRVDDGMVIDTSRLPDPPAPFKKKKRATGDAEEPAAEVDEGIWL
ncbi:Mutanase [Rhypophila decipiens]